MGSEERLRAWRAGGLTLIGLDSGGSEIRYLEVGADGAIGADYESGAFSLEDELYRWRYAVEDDQLRKYETSERWGAEVRESVKVVRRGLEAVDGAELERWRREFPGLLAEREGRRRADWEAEAAENARREAAFLAAVPPEAVSLELRWHDGGWAVAVPGQPPFWHDDSWPYRGKDLHHRLGVALRGRVPPVERFEAVLESEGEWMCYGDD